MKKLGQRGGFTLVEMLSCVVTLFLICMICTAGMNLAIRSYQESVFESDSQMLESTLTLYISDILRHATDIGTDKEGKLIFDNATYQISNGNIAVPEEKSKYQGNFLIYYGDAGEGIIMMSEDAYANLFIEGFYLSYDEALGVFEGGYTIKSNMLSDGKRVCTFTCRTIAE